MLVYILYVEFVENLFFMYSTVQEQLYHYNHTVIRHLLRRQLLLR